MEQPAQEHERENEPERYLVERVRQALAHDPRVNALDIRVRVRDGKVYLNGRVATPERRAAITDVVREVLPGYEVNNGTTLGEYPEPVAEEHVS